MTLKMNIKIYNYGYLEKIFGGAANDVIDNVGNLVDKFVQTPDERSLFKKQMTNILIEAEAEIEKILQKDGKLI